MTVATDLCVVHLTDPHLDPRHEPSAVRLASLADAIDPLCPDVIVCTGDLGASHTNGGMMAIKRFLDELDRPWLCVPGNKDIAVSDSLGGRGEFVRVFGAAYSVWTGGEYGLIGLDTAGDGISKYKCAGLGQPQWDWLVRQLESLRREGVTRLLCCTHMPLAAMDQPARQELFDLLVEFGVTTILAGHRHRNAVNHHGPIVEYVTAPCLPISGPSDPPTLRLLEAIDGMRESSLVAVDSASATPAEVLS